MVQQTNVQRNCSDTVTEPTSEICKSKNRLRVFACFLMNKQQ